MSMRTITKEQIQSFRNYLIDEEKSKATVSKYMHDITDFAKWIGEQEITKQAVLKYKEVIGNEYAITSANSMLAAINCFFKMLDWNDLYVKQFKAQKNVFCPAEKELTKEEYKRLVKTAEQKNNERLSLTIQTICGTGIRVSELAYITLETVRHGQATVSCKGKTRIIFIIAALQKKLLRYAREHHITSGAIFVTKSGKPMNRTNIWKEMKSLCKQAGVASEKVFPHNLRHLFARTFYGLEKDIAKLADILGYSSINTTRIYIVATGTEHKRRMENMRLII